MKDLPITRVIHRLGGSGTLRNSKGESVPVTRFRASVDKYDPGEAWEFTLYVAEEHQRRCELMLRQGEAALRFTGETGTGYPVEISHLWFRQWSPGVLTGSVDDIAIGDVELPSQPSEQHLTVELSPTALARPEISNLMRSYTGEITADEHWSQKESPMQWSSPLGTVTFVEHVEYEDVVVGRTKSTLQIPTPVLRLKLAAPDTSSRPLDLGRQLLREAEPLFVIITFLSRRYVRWRRVEVSSKTVGDDGSKGYYTSHLLNGVPVPERTGPQEPLINVYTVPDDVLDHMVRALADTPYRKVLESSMQHVTAANQAPFVEAAFVSAFTALETLTNGINKIDKSHKILGSADFSRLRSTVKGAIATYLANRADADTILQRVEKKLPELNRPPVVDRVEELIVKHGVEWSDLWPQDTDLQDALQKLFKRRNDFIHSGQLISVTQADTDAKRTTILTERSIYALLNGDPGWVSHLAYSDLYYLYTVDA